MEDTAVSFAAVNREQFYVSISRGRERCTIFTDDKDLLRDRVGRSRERKAALELQELKEALLREGFKQAAPAQSAPDFRAADVRNAPTRANGHGRSARPTRALRPTPNIKRGLSPSARIADLFHEWVGKIREALGIPTPAPQQTKTQQQVRPDERQQKHARTAQIAAAQEQQQRQPRPPRKGRAPERGISL